jgi:hypothetical protein
MSNGFLVRVISKTVGGAAKTEEWLAHVPDRFTALDAVEKRIGPGSFAQVIDRVPHATLADLGIAEGQVAWSRL